MKGILVDVWQSEIFQIGMDICRILLLLICVLIFYKLVTEVDAVKQINHPIRYFENKTNSRCECFFISNNTRAVSYPEINLSFIEEYLKNAEEE